MQDLTETFRSECLCDNERRIHLFGAFIQKSAVEKDIEIDDKEKIAFAIDLRNWLCRVMYLTCQVPIDERSAKAIAVMAPLAYWLFDHANQVEAAIHLLIRLHPESKEAICCLKLLDVIGRFRAFVLPEMILNNEATVKDLSQVYPEIYIKK